MRLAALILGAAATLLAQAAIKPGHDRVPPYREPSPYMSRTDVQAALAGLDPALVASRTGGSIEFARGKAPGVVRRRMRGPQYAITHTRTLEYMIVTKGTATLVTGGTVVDAKSTAPDEVRGRQIAGGETRTLTKGDVLIVPAGTPHWFEKVPAAFTYYVVKVRS